MKLIWQEDSKVPERYQLAAGRCLVTAIRDVQVLVERGGRGLCPGSPAVRWVFRHHGDTVISLTDLTIAWTGGSRGDSVLVRVTPHLRPPETASREGLDSLGTRGDHHGGKRPMGHCEGKFMNGGPLSGLGPEFRKAIDVMVPNTGSFVITASDIATLLGGTTTADLMVGVSEVVKQDVLHDGGMTSLVLRSGDRLVLHVK